jgi:hypothetical protein
MVSMNKDDNLISKIISAAVIGLLSWNTYTTQNLSVSVAVLETRVSSLQETISNSVIDRYTNSQATSDFALVEQKIKRLEEWNQNLSERIRLLEQESRNAQ